MVDVAVRGDPLMSELYPNQQMRISVAVIEVDESIHIGLDTVNTLAVLTWSFLGSVADIAIDLITGRELPQPDLKSVAAAPEPGAICKVRPPVAIPRPMRSKIRQDEAA